MPSKLKQIYNEYEEAIAYFIFGVLTTLVYYITRFSSRILLGEIAKAAIIATIIAQITAITFAYITNKRYVFKSKTENMRQLLRETVSFYMGRGVTFLLDVLITYIFIDKFYWFFIDIFQLENINYQSRIFNYSLAEKLAGSPEKMNEFIWTLFSQVIIFVLNYFVSKLLVFRKKKAKEEKDEIS